MPHGKEGVRPVLGWELQKQARRAFARARKRDAMRVKAATDLEANAERE
jgi:hypothetical protein